MGENKNFIKQFSQLGGDSIEIAGEKGANISELYNNHFLVPEGFIITTLAFENFIENSGIKEKIKDYLESVDLENEERLKSASNEIRKLILESELSEEFKEEVATAYEVLSSNKYDLERGSAFDILNNAYEPVFVAVRSSVPNPFKEKLREQDTYLNIKGLEELFEHIKKCFASLYREKTLKRIAEENTIDSSKLAVIVQKMINGEKSGKIYYGDQEIILESIWGLGEGMNLEEIIPDKYNLNLNLELKGMQVENKKFAVIRNSSGELKKIKLNEEIGNHQVLEDFEIYKLAKILRKVKEIYSKEIELEFVIKEEEIFLTQATPKKELPGKVESIKEKNVLVETKELKKIKYKKLISNEILPLVQEASELDYFEKEYFPKKIFIGIPELKKEIVEHKNYLNDFLNKFSNVENPYVILSGEYNSENRNNLLGIRGVKFLLNNKDYLKEDLKAISRMKNDPVIIIPNISLQEELKEFNEIRKELNIKNEIGIIIQNPSSLQLIKEFNFEGITHCLIDLEKLSQLMIGIDKSLPDSKKFYSDFPKSLEAQINYLIRVCKRESIQTSILINIPSREIIDYFIKMGINNFVSEIYSFNKNLDLISESENKIRKEDDGAPRKYELNKKLNEKLSEKIEEDISLIRKEKEEYLKENPE